MLIYNQLWYVCLDTKYNYGLHPRVLKYEMEKNLCQIIL